MNCFRFLSMRYLFLSFGLLFLFFSCADNDSHDVDISNIKVSVKLDRFDQAFFNATPENIASIRKTYPYLFPGNEPDSVWLRRKNDSLSQALYKESQKVFGNFSEQKKDLEKLFRYVTYYYPSFKAPKIITLISNLDMENQVIYADSLLLISLDTYLGEKSVFYSHYPTYLTKHYNKNALPIQVGAAIAQETLPKVSYRTFIDRMINEGKQFYALHNFLPDAPDSLLFAYSQKQQQWAQENEENIWKYFIEKDYLYNTDKELKARFLDPAPFSKFYLVTDNESPGRIGSWIGYQIVQSYMKYNAISLPQLMATTPTEIFKKSKYKPNR